MWIRIMARNDHQRASVSTPIINFLYFFAYFICVVELPALWMNCHRGNIRFARITQLSTDFWYILYLGRRRSRLPEGAGVFLRRCPSLLYLDWSKGLKTVAYLSVPIQWSRTLKCCCKGELMNDSLLDFTQMHHTITYIPQYESLNGTRLH